MSAESKWWYCGVCGFANHPRDERVYADVKINEKCEQCGAPSSHSDAIDFQPAGAS